MTQDAKKTTHGERRVVLEPSFIYLFLTDRICFYWRPRYA